jgi:sodium-coupled monocarboxylate transporter 8/12
MGIFILGSLFKFTNATGCIVSTVLGFFFGIWMSLGANFVQPSYPTLPQNTDYCIFSSNYTTYDIYEFQLKDSILVSNKFNSTYFANGQRATNLEGFNVFYSISYMYTFTFSLAFTVLVGILTSLLSGGQKTKVNESLIIFDLLEILKKKNKAKNNDMERNYYENELLTRL